MNHFLKSIFYAACASVFIVAVSGAIIRADFFIKLDNGKGAPKVIHSMARDLRITDLPAGSYTFSVCDEKGNDLRVTAQFEYAQQTTRKTATGTKTEMSEYKTIKISGNSGTDNPSNHITIYDSGSLLSCKAIVLP